MFTVIDDNNQNEWQHLKEMHKKQKHDTYFNDDNNNIYLREHLL